MGGVDYNVCSSRTKVIQHFSHNLLYTLDWLCIVWSDCTIYIMEDNTKLESNKRTTKIIFHDAKDNSDIVCDCWYFVLGVFVD